MQPVITIIEIYLDKKEKLEIEGCNIKTARNSKGGKVLLAFKESTQKSMSFLKSRPEHYRSIWVNIGNIKTVY